MAKHRLKHARIYDKRRPEGQQDVAFLVSCIADNGEPQILFSGQQYEGGVCFLNKQHAVEFATCMLAMALQLPGDIPEGDCLFSDGEGDMGPIDLLHPTGRCTCAGERSCAWCQTICRLCDGDGRDFPGTGPCERCKGSGWEPAAAREKKP